MEYIYMYIYIYIYISVDTIFQIDRYVISVSQMTSEMFHVSVLSSFMTYHWVCN